jgi:hypothetical protein
MAVTPDDEVNGAHYIGTGNHNEWVKWRLKGFGLL